MWTKLLRSPVPKAELAKAQSQVYDTGNFADQKVNLALAMVQKGKRVGILDADIFGPSIPRLLSLSDAPRTDERKFPFRSV